MKFIVIYDISSNSARLKASEYCKDFGLKRIQKSSFSGEISKNNAEMLGIKCQSIGLETQDCIYLIPCCSACFSTKIIIGELNEKSLEKQEVLILD